MSPAQSRIPIRTCALVFVLSCLMKLLTLNKNLYFSTDFEVHRNWLAITHSLPFSQWYKEARNVWTLDYPPFFAYFEYALSWFAKLVDSEMLSVDNIDYVSYGTIVFQRVSVILVSDLVLAISVIYALAPNGSSKVVSGVVLTLFSSSLFLVDHVHFQYNGMLLGLMIFSAALIDRGRVYLGATAYMILVFFKHIYLYAAPVYFIFCVRRFLVGVDRGTALKVFAGLAGVVICVSIPAVIPLIFSDQFSAALSRMFPFGRGLVHSYWAPNLWAIYLFTDRILGKVLSIEGGISSTSGLVQVTNNLVLPDIGPHHTLILTLACYIPLLWLVWKRCHAIPLMPFAAWGNAVCFMVGWHIHEKAILMVYYPLIVFAIGSAKIRSEVWTLSIVACASLLPLMPHGQETTLKWILCAAGATLEWIILGPNGDPLWIRIVPCMAVVPEVYRVFVHGLVMKDKYEFLPLMMNSVINALLLLFVLLKSVKSATEIRKAV